MAKYIYFIPRQWREKNSSISFWSHLSPHTKSENNNNCNIQSDSNIIRKHWFWTNKIYRWVGLASK